MSDVCLGLSALPLQQNSCPPRDRAGAARPKGSCIWEARVCMACEELRMDMGVNLCVSALKFNINCSDESQSGWILLNFLLRKKIPLLFFFSLKTRCSHIIRWGGKTHRLQQILGVKLTVKKKKGTEAEKQIFKIPLFGIRTQKDSLLVCSFFRSARTMTGYGNSTVSVGNLSACQVPHGSKGKWSLKHHKKCFCSIFNATNSRNCYRLQNRGNEKGANATSCVCWCVQSCAA